MSKLYCTALVLTLVGGSAFGQRASDAHGNLPTRKNKHFPMHHQSTPVIHGADRLVIWSDDFSVPANWTPGTMPATDPENWVIGTAGPSGAFAIDPIESTTAANNFAMYDTDLYCGGNQHAYIQMTNSVDLSAYPGAVLQFEQLFRRFRGDCFVDVSINGIDWNEIEVNDAVDVNELTPNPELYSVNISPWAGGQSTVWIRFRYFSTVAVHGNGGGCDYAWMVDDVAIVTLPDNEIRMDYGYTSHTGNGEEYGRIPTDQLNPTMNVGAQVFNFGGLEQTNVVINMSILNESLVEIATATEAVGTIAAQDTAFMDQDITLPDPLPVGLYTANFTLTSDQIGSDDNPANNTAVRTFRVTDDLYTIDGIGDHPAGLEVLSQTGTSSFTDNTENVRLLNYYEIRTTMDATGVLIELGPLTNVGSFFSVSVYDTTDVFSVDLTQPLAETDFHTITAAEVAAGTSFIALDGPLTLDPGGYFVSANIYASGTSQLFILDDETVPQPNATSMLWIPVDDQNQFLYGGNGTAWAVRLSLDPTIGISENTELTGVSMYPNPTNGILHIATEHNGTHTVMVMNVLGEVVMTTSFAGNTKIDLAAFANGVYSVRVSNGTSSSVQRITLN